MASRAPSQQTGARRTALIAGAMALGMLCLGFASVPLYRLFCQVTGFGGTTQRASEAQYEKASASGQETGKPVSRTFSVRFDSNMASGMPWQFYPEKKRMSVDAGGRSMAIFVAKNLSDKPVTGRAVFNVTPTQAGAYFNKIQCFCFTEQTLKPGQQVRMPVLYYIDPAILNDPDNKDTQEITLSYTFYPVEKPADGS